MLEFHVSRNARDKYDFDQSLFALSGNVIFANFHSARQFAQKINAKRDLVNYPEKAIQAGQINALGLIDEIFHYVVHEYLREYGRDIWTNLYDLLEEKFGNEEIGNILNLFSAEFPPLIVYQKEQTISQFLSDTSDGVPNIELTLEEILMLWLTNKNPATSPYSELFDDQLLSKSSMYKQIIHEIETYFEKKPLFGPDNQDLISMLRSPAIAVPHSLSGQLDYIRHKWGSLLGNYLYRLMGSLDFIKEEQRLIFIGGAGPTMVPQFRDGYENLDEERFSPDSDWMPKVIMMAKNSYVWLSQLSKRFNRKIQLLNEIPDEVLDELARWGFTGLWLIGLWERSTSSKRIKQMCGNPDAVASAYSLARYDIAQDLGGESAYQNLRERCIRRGIRLASDMVPNHMGIDSSWVYDHPDWFVNLDYSPFPSYSFNGPDLSTSPNVSINLEDHYYDRSDAAVVFKRYDHNSGQTNFIYHGNDGTSMPWNDTAQLNYLIPEVREAVIQTILSVARRFPIIRFDAAMTLTKKHYQRLWFPQPGTGGDIPSRADFSLTKETFDRLMPEEFWREVVDRVATEVPDTLLLAEAFWLMEGYFVRTLGMHRVYNSAFMNMLRNEENQKYRLLIKNTLEFDSRILKRYVNFMNNPDEKTAVEQFGKGDKYFGICTLMATMPGLPMFGHGQVEGYSEKYGMEYYRPYWDESPDNYLIHRHEQQVFPILHKRYLFADVNNFLLYDLFTDYGYVDENVFAYSNGNSYEHGLVIYHNNYGTTKGWIKTSTAYNTKNETSDSIELVQKDIYNGLNLQGAGNHYVIYKDYTNNLEYIRSSQEIKEKGFFFELNAYQYHVFMDFREVEDDYYQKYRRLAEYLHGGGVPSVEAALNELILASVLNPVRELINNDLLEKIQVAFKDPDKDEDLINQILQSQIKMLNASAIQLNRDFDLEKIKKESKSGIETLLSLRSYLSNHSAVRSKKVQKIVDKFHKDLTLNPENLNILSIWLFLRFIGGESTDSTNLSISRSLIDEWQINKIIDNTLFGIGLESQKVNSSSLAIKYLIQFQDWFEQSKLKSLKSLFNDWVSDEAIRSYLEINRYKDVLWFNKEAFENLLWLMEMIALINTISQTNKTVTEQIEDIISCNQLIQKLEKSKDNSDYQLLNLIEGIN